MRSSCIATVAVLLFSAASQAIVVPTVGESSIAINEKRFAFGEEAISDASSVALERRGPGYPEEEGHHSEGHRHGERSGEHKNTHLEARHRGHLFHLVEKGAEAAISSRSIQLEPRGRGDQEKKKTLESVTKGYKKDKQSAEDRQRTKTGADKTKADADLATAQRHLNRLGQIDELHKQVKAAEADHTTAAKAFNKATNEADKKTHAATAAAKASEAGHLRDQINGIAKEYGFHNANHDDASRTMHEAAALARTHGVATLDPTPQATRAKAREANKSG